MQPIERKKVKAPKPGMSEKQFLRALVAHYDANRSFKLEDQPTAKMAEQLTKFGYIAVNIYAGNNDGPTGVFYDPAKGYPLTRDGLEFMLTGWYNGLKTSTTVLVVKDIILTVAVLTALILNVIQILHQRP